MPSVFLSFCLKLFKIIILSTKNAEQLRSKLFLPYTRVDVQTRIRVYHLFTKVCICAMRPGNISKGVPIHFVKRFLEVEKIGLLLCVIYESVKWGEVVFCLTAAPSESCLLMF